MDCDCGGNGSISDAKWVKLRQPNNFRVYYEAQKTGTEFQFWTKKSTAKVSLSRAYL
jgi:hypothetical protein